MTRVLGTLLCIGALAAGGCSAPDLRRGKAELETGNIDAAEADLLPLADLGYEDAKLQLARVYARRADPDSRTAAIKLYRELLRRNPEVAVPLGRMLLNEGNGAAIAQGEQMLLKAEAKGDPMAAVTLLELYSDHPERDTKGRAAKLAGRVAKIKTPEAEGAVIKWYRRNALADEKYARELIKHCESGKDRLPDCYVDLVRHYRATNAEKQIGKLVGNATDRMNRGTLPPQVIDRFGWSLVSDDYPGRAWPEAGYPLLRKAAERSDVAAVRLARLLIEYPHLDPQARPEQLLLQAGQQGNSEAALALGRLYLDGKQVPGDPRKAERYLQQAAPTQPGAHYYLGRLYKRGYLGRADPVRAAQHYLTAARAGYVRADHALAELFSDNRGVKPNLANAFVFATLAAEERVPEGEAVLKQVRAQMKPAQLEEGKRLLRDEIAVRNSLPRAAERTTARSTPEASP